MTVGKFTRPDIMFYRWKKRVKLVPMDVAEQEVDGSPSDEIACPGCGAELPHHARFCRMCGEHINGQHNQKEGDETIRLPVLSHARGRYSSTSKLVRYSSTSKSVNNINLNEQNARGSIPLEEKLPTTPLSEIGTCLLYTSPSPRDRQKSRMPSSA